MKMISFLVIIAILSINGAQAGDENNGPNIGQLIKALMEATRPTCAEKLDIDEEDLIAFENRFKSNEFLESDPETYGAYVGCLLREWGFLKDNGELNPRKFSDYEKQAKNNPETLEKIKSKRERLTNLLKGTTSLADSGSRLIAAKIKAKENNDNSMNDGF